jgi:hypothetical protein
MANVGCVEKLCKACCGKSTEVMCALVSHNIAKILYCEKGIDEGKKRYSQLFLKAVSQKMFKM